MLSTTISLGGQPLQLALAVLIGVIYVFRRNSTSICAAKAGAKASFIIGAAFMLFSYEKRWWPAGATILALGSWVIAGWLAAWLGYYAGVYIRQVIRRTRTRLQEAGRKICKSYQRPRGF